MVSDGPAEVRRQVRDWLTDVLGAEGCAADLPEPADWSGWDASADGER